MPQIKERPVDAHAVARHVRRPPPGGNEGRTGGEIFVACLEAHGVETVFGLCGHTVIGFMDAMVGSKLNLMSFRHEQLAAHAADGFFRVTHKPGVLMTHLGPGLTNAITGVANASLDSSAMVVIAGDIPTQHFGRDAHQEVKLFGDATQFEMYKPFVKRAWRVQSVEAIPDIIARAFNIATSGRPGPVLIDVPMDLFSRRADVKIPDMAQRQVTGGRVRGDREAIAKAADLLVAAKAPAIYAGGGVILSEASATLTALAEHLGAPVATSLMGKGSISEENPLAMGMTGFWGTRVANDTVRQADVVLGVGTRFAEADCSSWMPEYTFAIPPTRLIHIDIDPQEIGKNYPTEISVVGDARAVLEELLAEVAARTPPRRPQDLPRTAELVAAKQAWWKGLGENPDLDRTPIHPYRILKEVRELLPADAIVVTDVGWNKNGLAQQFPVTLPQTHFPPGGFATMGFGPAAVIGVKKGAPDRTVMALIGDGAMGSVAGVLATAREQNTKAVWLVMNNFAFGTIYGLQQHAYQRDLGTRFVDPLTGENVGPNFAEVAKGFGVAARRVEKPEDLRPALIEALAHDGPYLLDVVMDRSVAVPTDGYWDILDIYQY
jgi:acetolactate synthase I/II/III large subunit